MLQVAPDKLAFVGLFEPQLTQVLPVEFNYYPPNTFHLHLDKLPQRAYYNNMYWIDYFPADQIIMCLADGQRKLSEFTEYSEMKDVYNNGEIVHGILAMDAALRKGHIGGISIIKEQNVLHEEGA